MKAPLRQDVLDALSELSDYWPDMRFGQMIANLAVVAQGIKPEAVWDMEDEELLAAAKREIELSRERAAAGAS